MMYSHLVSRLCLIACYDRACVPGRRSLVHSGCVVQQLRRVQVLTAENVEALRDSVRTLTRTLDHVEAISGDVSGLTADTKVKGNFKQLVEALSRLVTD